MSKSVLKLTSIILLALFIIAMIPTAVAASEKTEAKILQKTTNEKIIYIKGMDSTEFKYAFSDSEDNSGATYVTALKDSNGEYVATMEAGENYKYIFLQNGESTETLELSKMKSITEKEIQEVEQLTKIIKVSTDQTESKVSKEGDTTVTKTKGKIVVTDEGKYQYQLIKVLDKDGSTKNLNETAVELYNQLSKLNSATKMYDKLSAEITIRDNFKKLLEDAKWKDAKKDKQILQPEDSQEGEKFVVLIQEVKDGDTVRTDVQFMTCGREDDEGVEKTEKQEKKVVEKKTALPVTGENLALYIIFGIIILAIIILIVRMRKSKKDEE